MDNVVIRAQALTNSSLLRQEYVQPGMLLTIIRDGRPLRRRLRRVLITWLLVDQSSPRKSRERKLSE